MKEKKIVALPKKRRGRPRNVDKVVNSPKHYLTGDVECIDAMVSAFGKEAVQSYARINAFKYLWRAGKKSSATKQDIQKANWYMRFSIGDDPRQSP